MTCHCHYLSLMTLLFPQSVAIFRDVAQTLNTCGNVSVFWVFYRRPTPSDTPILAPEPLSRSVTIFGGEPYLKLECNIAIVVHPRDDL